MAGGLLAAAFLPVAVASADEYGLAPDPSTSDPAHTEGYPPVVNIETGTEFWAVEDFNTNQLFNQGLDVELGGTDTHTAFGSFTNDNFLQTGPSSSIGPIDNIITFAHGDQIDLAKMNKSTSPVEQTREYRMCSSRRSATSR